MQIKWEIDPAGSNSEWRVVIHPTFGVRAPTVVGHSEHGALALLAGLNIETIVDYVAVSSHEEANRVIEQSVGNDEYVDPSAGVRLQVGFLPESSVTTAGFLAPDGEHFVSAVGDRSTINAEVAEFRGWENFELTTVKGPLYHGAQVSIKTAHGKYWIAHKDETLSGSSNHVKGWETFFIEKIAYMAGQTEGSLIDYGDQIALRTAHGTYVSAKQAGGGEITADGPRIGSWETFTLVGNGVTAPTQYAPELLLESKASRNCFDSGGYTDEGKQVHTWDCDPENEYQTFELVRVNLSGDDEEHFIKSTHSGLCLGAADLSNGAALVLAECDNRNITQQWQTIDLDDDGWKQYKMYQRDFCIDLRDGGTANGTKLQVWSCESGVAHENQSFRPYGFY